MLFRKAEKEDIPGARALWELCFEDGTEGFCDFVFGNMSDRIYVARDCDEIVSMLIAAGHLEYKDKQGFYLYSACTFPKARNRGIMRDLVAFSIGREAEEGRTFCVLEPASPELFDFWKNLGFENVSDIRECLIPVKKNIWQTAEFDIATAGRMKMLRDKFSEGNIVHYSKKDYELYATYLYTFGGSTAESDKAFAVYYTEGETLAVKELLAASTPDAISLLQAIRERTGLENADIILPRDSLLFAGEGREKEKYLTLGLDENAYINLMFE